MMSSFRKEIAKLEKEKAKAQLSNDLKKEAELCNELGQLYADNGDHNTALKEHQQELQLCESASDVVGAAVAHRRIGECHLELGCFPLAIRHHQQHHSLATEAGSHVEQQRALTTIGRTYFCQAETLEDDERQAALEKAKNAYLGSMSVCQGHLKGVVSTREYHEMRARIFLNLGLVYDLQDDFNSSVKFIQQAVNISQQNKLHDNLIRCQLDLAEIYRCAGEFRNSLQCLGKASLVAKELKNKDQQREIFLLQGTVHFHLGDFVAAGKTLKKAHKMGSNNDAEREKIKRALQSAIRCSRLEKAIEKAASERDQKQILNLEEQVGDICCKMKSYGVAIQHYRKQLECATMLDVPPSQLIPIYVSLAQTYADNKQYSSEVEMYREELKLRSGNPQEECKTWLNVAFAQEQSGQDYSVLQESYNKALECAVTAGIPKLQLRALTSLKLVQEHFKEEAPLASTNRKLSRLKSDHGLVSGDEDSDEGEGTKEETNSLDTEELDLSDTDDSEGEHQHEEFDRPPASRRAQRAKFDKRNEKGETLLHRACIDGNLRQVKSLLEQGHPVNPRDYCGWLPLHEACNHDYPGIVEVLLEHGAAINDRGGAQCGGITPLHDAVACGNLEVAELLVRKGASVIAKDDQGLSALDTLNNWAENNAGGLDDDTMERGNHLRLLMVDASKGPLRTFPAATLTMPEDTLLNSDLFDAEENSQSQSETGTLSQYGTKGLSKGSSQAERHRQTSHNRPTQPGHRGASLRNQRDLSSGSDSDGYAGEQLSSLCDDLPLMPSHQRKRPMEPSMKGSSTGARSRSGSNDKHQNGQRHESNNHRSPVRVDYSESPTGSNGTHTASSDVSNKSQKQDVTSTYRNAMASIGSSATSRATSKKTTASSSSRHSAGDEHTASRGPGDALIAEDRFVDDWLIEDMVPTKRRRLDCDVFQGLRSTDDGASGGHDDDVFGETGPSPQRDVSRDVDSTAPSWQEEAWPETGLDEDDGLIDSRGNERVTNSSRRDRNHRDRPLTASTHTQRNTTSKLARKKKKQKQLKLTGIVSQRPRSPMARGVGGSEPAPLEVDIASSPSRAIPSAGPSQEIAYPIVIQSPPSATPSTMRVKVRVQGKVFLISVPLSSSKTIKWLSEETTKRYYSFSGLRPQLSLTTADNALFSPEDVISETLNNNEEILATVESWELPPLHERYKTQCEKESQSEHPKIKSRIESLDGHNLDLSQLTLKDRPLRPVLSALQCQYSLRRLVLSRNRLTDASVGCLGDAIASLPNLCHLDLSGNEVSHEGLRRISGALLKEVSTDGPGVGAPGYTAQKPLQHLEELILDYNPLSDSSALYIANILKHCPLLSRLGLSSTDLTCRFFQLHRNALLEAFQGANYLETLNISHNALGSAGVRLLLKCLKEDKISCLNVASVIDKPGDRSLTKHLADFYSKQNCSLQRLCLEDCRLNNSSMDFLTKCIPHVPSKNLSHLNLSTNPHITQEGVITLLAGLRKQGCGLGSIDLSMCGLASPLDGRFFDLLGGFMESSDPSNESLTKLVLSQNKLNRNDLEVLISVWEAVHGESATHCIDSVRCTLSAS